jgi:hypothetical protein
MLRNRPASEIFAALHKQQYWSKEGVVSGSGSTLQATESVRRNLPTLFRTFAIRSIFDAPCGDFHWMQHVVRECDIAYFGADIVPALIEKNIETYQGEKIQFAAADICKDPLPAADLWLCRDCFIHLSCADILTALENFCASSVPRVLMTTATAQSGIKNCDIPTGQYREINLFAEPFLFPEKVLFRIADPAEGELCLWSREQIAQALPQLRTWVRSAKSEPAHSVPA